MRYHGSIQPIFKGGLIHRLLQLHSIKAFIRFMVIMNQFAVIILGAAHLFQSCEQKWQNHPNEQLKKCNKKICNDSFQASSSQVNLN